MSKSQVELLHTFNIPSPEAMCHASTLLPLSDSEVLLSFFAGSHEGAADTAIYLCTVNLTDGSYSKMRKVASGSEAHWNPVLFGCADGSLVLIYKCGNEIASWRSMLMRSQDKGESWSSPCELVAGDKGGRGPVRNAIVALSDGTLLCPASLESGTWRCFADKADPALTHFDKSTEVFAPALPDAGEGSKSGIAVSAQSFAGSGVIQPALWEDTKGVHMLMRSTLGSVMRADSADFGCSWSQAYPVGLPNNNSALSCLWRQHTLFTVCNPVAANWGPRTPLCLFSSEDGLTFRQELVLASGQGEFSYPWLASAGDDRHLLVSYTNNRQAIALAVMAVSSKECPTCVCAR